MAAKSKRRAREAALRALYEIELGHARLQEALDQSLAFADLTPELAQYTERVVRGIREKLPIIDQRIAPLIHDYDYSRIAVVDRNVLRIATYELLEEPAIPPAVTINEAIEIAKRFSTAESGRFVNGVLGSLLQETPKANWDPRTAPPEYQEEPAPPEPEPEIEEEVVEEGSQEAKTAQRFGVWKLRSGDAEIPPLSEGKE
jgi:N utilization substance protein B